MDAINLLDREVYTASQADRLIGVTTGTVRRWVDGYDARGKSYEPLIRERRTGADAVTWGEYVEARLISEYRQLGARVFHLRPAIMRLREEFGEKYPLAYARLFTEVQGRELVLRVQDETRLQPSLYMVLREGQLRLPSLEVNNFQKSVDYDTSTGAVARVNIGSTITVDPLYSFGEPTVRGRRLRAASIIEAVAAGESRKEIRETWDISDETIDDAVRCSKIA